MCVTTVGKLLTKDHINSWSIQGSGIVRFFIIRHSKYARLDFRRSLGSGFPPRVSVGLFRGQRLVIEPTDMPNRRKDCMRQIPFSVSIVFPQLVTTHPSSILDHTTNTAFALNFLFGSQAMLSRLTSQTTTSRTQS